MILTEYVMYRGKKKPVSEVSSTSGYKVDVECPECKEVRNVFLRSVRKAGHHYCQKCVMKKKFRKNLSVGAKYNRLTVVEPSRKAGFSICRCDCGNLTEVANDNLKSGGTKSCGCYRIENIKRFAKNPGGKKHWNWKGGTSTERELAMSKKKYKNWRKSVFERDSFTCQKCKQVGRQIRAHHIYNFADYPKKRLELNNGITFCEKCHREYHRINGFKTNEKQLKIFLERG